MAATIPAIELAHHRHPPRVRRPDRETHTGNAVLLQQLGAQAAAQVAVIAFGEEVEVQLAKQGTEGVRVFGFLLAARPLDAQAVGRALGQLQLEEPLGIAARHRSQ
ncbi:hypothetical protein D9M73_272410 [compost metagenome]